MNDRFRLDAIGQIHIGVDDCDRAVAFYRDVLGMRFMFELWLAGFRDSEGNYLHLMCEAPLNERRES